MANPQANDGHLDLAHELTEALCRTPLSGSELRVCLFILRKTWGWKKKSDTISIGQVQKGTSLNRTTVVESLKKLVAKRLLVVVKGQLPTSINSYQFNKNYDEWLVVNRRIGGYQKTTTLVGKGQPKLVGKRQPTKEKKETLTKESIPADERQTKQPSPLYELVDYVSKAQGVRPFPVKGRQYQAAKQILDAGYTLEEAKAAVDRMRADVFWASRVFDVPTLARHIPRYAQEGVLVDPGKRHDFKIFNAKEMIAAEEAAKKGLQP